MCIKYCNYKLFSYYFVISALTKEIYSQTRLENESGHYVRPTTLFMGDFKSPDGILNESNSLQPEREALKFDVNLVGAPYEVEQLVFNIKKVAEQFLYHWKTFPIGKLIIYCIDAVMVNRF